MRTLASILAIAAFGAAALGAEARVLERHAPPSEWRVSGRADPSSLLQLTVAVHLDGPDELEARLHAVSTPGSESYGAHLLKSDVDALVRPVCCIAYAVPRVSTEIMISSLCRILNRWRQ